MNTAKPARLQTEIDERRSEIHTDQCPMSIGEIANMYRDREIDIHPEFQRLYRWSEEQKSRFVESIMLGIPIPSLFVSQRMDGKWDVIDGMQRISTILQLMGVLRDDENKTLAPALVLTKTKYLSCFEGMQWNSGDPTTSLTEPQKLYIKRAKLDFKIILRESDESAKFELFQRLNTGGAQLSSQEIRNAMLVAASPEFFQWLKALSANEDFASCVSLSDRAYEEQFEIELVLRFVIFRSASLETAASLGDLGEFLTDEMMKKAENFSDWKVEEDAAFRNTFKIISEKLGADAFRKYDHAKNRFTRGFSISAFEIVAMGIGFHANSQLNSALDIRTKVEKVWLNPEFLDSSGSGIRASTRIPKTLKIGREIFGP